MEEGFESFDEVRSLDAPRLNALLASDRPEHRVWAIWALALKTGAGQLTGQLGREPDPGVRRTLAVILAGHGETDLLVALARHDPSIAVRASAIQLVTRLAAGGAIDRAIVVEATTREPEIQIALLGAIDNTAPEFLVAIAHRLIDAPELDVQAEAFEALLRIATQPARDAARTWMLRLPEPSTVVDRWLRAADVESLVEAFVGTAMATRGLVISQLRSPMWRVIEPLIGGDLELLRTLLRRVDFAIPARVLAETIQRGAHGGFVERLGIQLAIGGQGRELLADLRRAIESGPPVEDREHEALLAVIGRVERFAKALEITDHEDVIAEITAQHPVEQLLGLENALGRWLVEADAPADLIPMLPDLQRYCAAQIKRLTQGGAGRRRRRLQQTALPGPGQPASPTPLDELELFQRLAASIDRILLRS